MANNSSNAPAQKKTGLQVFAQICASLTIISRGLLTAICIKCIGGFSEVFFNVDQGTNITKGGSGVPDSNTLFMIVLFAFAVVGILSYIPSILTIIFACIKKARSGIVIAGAITFGATLIIDILCAVVIAYF